jgi:hypothetical protein
MSENTIEMVKVESKQLDEIILHSGLEIQKGEEIKQSYIPFLNELAEVQEQSIKINFKDPKEIDETIARELRLKTVKIRTKSADLKDNRKKNYLLLGNLEQAAYNLIAASCKVAEQAFVNVEKAKEIAEAKRRGELKIQRDNEMLEFAEYIPENLDLGLMSDEGYDKLKAGAMLSKEAKITADKKAEDERLAKIEAERKENERIRIENEKLKADAIEKERLAEIESKKQVIILAKQQKEAKEREAIIKAENEKKLAEEKAKADKLAAENKIKEDKLKAELKTKEEAAAKLKQESEMKLKQEQESKAKLEKELADKKAAEAKIKAEAELKAKKEAAAPDKTKLTLMVKNLSLQEVELKTEAAQVIHVEIEKKFVGFKIWCENQIKTL